ncbi:MAG: CAP domain-containing protein [Blastochloris sp.]|nr:CAP domain-containing protein [Blastochloris sp.]
MMKQLILLGLVLFTVLPDLQGTEDEGLKSLMQLINQERVKAGKKELVMSPDLMGIAWEWSYRMSKEGRLKHRKNLLELCEKHDFRFMNENLHLNLSEFSAAKVVKSWMESPAHRRNMLEDKIALMGVGYAKAGDGTVFVVFNGAAKVDP